MYFKNKIRAQSHRKFWGIALIVCILLVLFEQQKFKE